MVAPSFQSMTIMSETYTKNGKLYIDVKNEKTGTIRSVRWYSDKEYSKAYGTKSIAPQIYSNDRLCFMPAGVHDFTIIKNGNTRILKATVAAHSIPLARVKLWQAYYYNIKKGG